MNVYFRAKTSEIVHRHQRGVERLRQALRHLQQLLAVDRQPEALGLIPIRAVQPHVARQPQRRNRRD